MGHVEVDSKIKAPVGKVWDFLWDFKMRPKWVPFLKRVEVISKQTRGLGTMARFQFESKRGKVYEFEMEVVECVEKKKVVWRLVSGPMYKRFEDSYVLKPIESGTLLTEVVDYKLPWHDIRKVLDKFLPIHGRAAHAQLEESMEREHKKLKALLKRKRGR